MIAGGKGVQAESVVVPRYNGFRACYPWGVRIAFARVGVRCIVRASYGGEFKIGSARKRL